MIVAAVAQPPFHPKLVDRFLVICQYGGIRPILCLNKCDLVASPPDVSIYEQLGLPIVYTSAATGLAWTSFGVCSGDRSPSSRATAASGSRRW